MEPLVRGARGCGSGGVAAPGRTLHMSTCEPTHTQTHNLPPHTHTPTQVAMLKMKLGAFGWHEAVRRERKPPRAAGAAAAQDMRADLQDYLERMGVRWALARALVACLWRLPAPSPAALWRAASKEGRARVQRAAHPRPAPRPAPPRRSDAAIRERLAAALPFNDIEAMASPSALPGGAPTRPAHLLRPLARPPTPRGGAVAPAPLIVVPDADASLGDLADALSRLGRRAYALDLPPRRHLARLRTVGELAGLLAQAVLDGAPPGPYVIAGVGMGGVVAHELAAQLQRAGQQARALRGVARRGAAACGSRPPLSAPA